MIILDYKDRRPIYEQVTEKMIEMMMLGVLEQDSQLPSVRSLAMDLAINPNTIQRAYAKLEQQGYIYSVKGKGSYVADIRDIKDSKRQDVVRQLGALVWKARCLGMTKEELLYETGRLYEEGGASK